MKHAVQIVGILLIFLLGAGPAVAAVSCFLTNRVIDTACPMGMAPMSADCPTAHMIPAPDCSQDCCDPTSTQPIVIAGFAVKPKFLLVLPRQAELGTLPAAESASSPEPFPHRAATSLPRHVLLRVFRI